MGAKHRKAPPRRASKPPPRDEPWLSRRSTHVALAQTLVAAIGVAVAAIALFGDPDGTPSGSGVDQAPARAVVQLLPRSGNAVVARPADRLGEPPRYPAEDRANHCPLWWKKWLETKAAAEFGSGPTIEVRAPRQAPVTITRASIRVFRSYTPRDGTYIACLSGAGPRPGTRLNVDLTRPNAPPTIVADDGRDQALALPAAVIAISRGSTELVAIYARGAPKIYEWGVRLTLVTDQRTQTASFGSRGRPLRTWLGDDVFAHFDYDFDSRTWIQAG